jgi:hypothetical protein
MNAARSPAKSCAGGPSRIPAAALLFQRRQAAREDRLADQRHRLAQIERAEDRPLARALLAGGVQNLIHQRLSVFVLVGKDLARYFNQVAVQLALVPLGEDPAQLIGGQSQTALQQVVSLADQLHVAVLDPVVDHLDEVAGPVLAHPVAAGRAVLHLGGDGLEDGLHRRPRRRIAAGHDRGAAARSFFAARDAGADEENAFRGQRLGAPAGVGKQRVAAVDDDVARFQVRQQMFDHLIDTLARLHHQHRAARPLQQPDELLDGVGSGDLGPFGFVGQKVIHLGNSAVVHGHLEAMIVHVEDQILSHDSQADQADITRCI